MQDRKNILVCGGAGYIGQIFCRHLIEKNQFNVVIVDNFSTSKKEYIRDDIQYVEADVRDTDKIINILTKYKIDCVVHFCAFSLVGESVQQPLKYYDNNIVGMIHLLEAMQKCNVKNLIFSSTAATYGEPEQQPITEDTVQKPINPYGLSKLIMEQIVNTCDFINSIAFRYFNVAGAAYDSWERHNPETHLIPCVIKRKLAGQNCFVFGNDYPTRDGTCVRDYIHVKDLAEAHYLGIMRLFEQKDKVIHEAYNLGTKTGLTVKEIVSEINCPYEVKDRRAGDPAVLIASNEKAKNILGWEPKETLHSIIQSAVDAHTKEHQKPVHSVITLVLLTLISFLSLYHSPKSKTVLITGASSGIGKQFALWFGQQQNWKIFINGRNESELNNVKQQIMNISKQSQVEIIKMELNSDESVTQLVDKLYNMTHNLDIVINCAGITHKVPDDLIDLSQDEIQKMIQINIIAFTSLARQITKKFFQPQKYGLFLQFSSGAAMLNQPMLSVYCASKNYQISLIKCINEEVKAFNAHFIAICPLYVSTPMTLTSKTDWLFISPQTLVQEIVKSNLQKQYLITHWSHKLVIFLLNLLPNSLNKNILYSSMITTRGKIINKLKRISEQNTQQNSQNQQQ